jgi:hypothetical protein
MSSLAYGLISRKRDEAQPQDNLTDTTGLKTYVDAVAALVPAEVLAAHAVILSFTTTTGKVQGASGAMSNATTITQPTALKVAFVGLLLLSAGLYLAGRKPQKVTGGVILGTCIPPLAFVAWTMIQRTTAFDALAPGMNLAVREVIAVLLAVILPVVAAGYAGSLNSSPPSPATVGGSPKVAATHAGPATAGQSPALATPATPAIQQPASSVTTPPAAGSPLDDPDATRIHRADT